MMQVRGAVAAGRGPMTHTTYAPAFRSGAHSMSAVDWRRRTGLTHPSVLSAVTVLRVAGLDADPTYADFFEASA